MRSRSTSTSSGSTTATSPTSRVDIETAEELITDVPAGKTVVAESGYDTREQLEELDRIGFDAVLIGEALMRSADPQATVQALTAREPVLRIRTSAIIRPLFRSGLGSR